MRKNNVWLLAVLMIPVLAVAQGNRLPASADFSLEVLLREARERNPDIQAAEQAWRAAEAGAPQAGSLPDPQVRYTLFGRSIETRLGPQRNKFSLTQTIPFFGKLPLKERIAAAEARVSLSRYRGVVADVMLEVKDRFFTLLWLDRTTGLLEKEADVIDGLIRVATVKYQAGKASQQDVLKAQLELTRLQDRLLGLLQSRRSAASQLNALLNRPPETEVPPLEFGGGLPAEDGREGFRAAALANRPEIAQFEYMVSRDRRRLDLAEKNYYPDFQVMVEYVDIGVGTTPDPRDGRDAWMASVGMNIPLWRKKLRAGKAEAQTRLRASEKSLAALQRKTEALVHELHDEMATAEEQLALYADVLLPQAEQTLKASEAGYLAGKVDFLTLLESQRMILTIRMGMERIFSEIWKTNARLERLTGLDLDAGMEGQNTRIRERADNGGFDAEKY